MAESKSHPPYRCLEEGGIGEIVEKKSRFIATVRKVESEAEATAFIDELKKKYWDASHNCSAFVIGQGAQLSRCSDDGEPSGTAGRPMLEVLLQEGICNIAVVVTRYFGGTLLGTGGLVRAYGSAVKAGLNESLIVTMQYATHMKITTNYTDIGKIQYLLGKQGIAQRNAEYTDIVTLEVIIPFEMEDPLIKELTETTAGRVRTEILAREYFAF